MNRFVSYAGAVGRLLGHLWLALIQNLPGPVGYDLRRSYWKKRLKALGSGVRIDCCVSFQNPEFISVGDNCWIDRNVMILAGIDRSARRSRRLEQKSMALRGEVHIGRNAHIGASCVISGIEGGVFIGDDCTLSAGVKVYAFTHHYRFDDDPGDRTCSFGSLVDLSRQMMIFGPVTLERNVGVALNAVILPGVWIGKDSFVAVASVLYKQEFPENSLIEGNPARRKGARFETVQNGRHRS